MKYLFMRLGSTKSWADCQAAIYYIDSIRRAGIIKTLTCNCSPSKAANGATDANIVDAGESAH